ncbi:hypothetical protein OROGR_020363 [Orobanche gracilis]
MAVEVERVFIGAGCNRIVHDVSWGACDLLAFGVQNAVAIFCPKRAQILTTLPGHKAYVNCTHWLPSSKFAFRAKNLEMHYMLSGDADGEILPWEFSLADRKWRNVVQIREKHKKGVTCITTIVMSQTSATFASSSPDGVVSVWKINFPTSAEVSYVIDIAPKPGRMNTKIVLALCVGALPDSMKALPDSMQVAGHQVYTEYRKDILDLYVLDLDPKGVDQQGAG